MLSGLIGVLDPKDALACQPPPPEVTFPSCDVCSLEAMLCVLGLDVLRGHKEVLGGMI